MDELKHQAFFAAVSWLIQINSSNTLAVATALYSDDDLIQPQKLYKRLSPIYKLINVQKPEDKGGLSDHLFKFFIRFTKDKVRKLVRDLNLLTKFITNPRSSWLNALTSLPNKSLLIFLQRLAYPLPLRYIIFFFSYS